MAEADPKQGPGKGKWTGAGVIGRRAAANRKAWDTRKRLAAARQASGLEAAMAGAEPGSAMLDPEDGDPGAIMRRALDALKAREGR